jgi:flagellar basal-body rod protein FlgC
VWGSNINEVQEMIEMLDASRGYQNNVEVIKTAKDLMMRTLEIANA